MALNKVLLIGNVGEILKSGISKVEHPVPILLATTERFRDRNGETKEITEWHNIVAWRQLADLAGRFIKKGSQIYVEGRIRSRSWDDANGQKRYITEILADTIQLLGRRDDTLPRDGAWDDSAGTSRPSDSPAHVTKTCIKSLPSQPASQSEQFVTSDDIMSDGHDDLPF